MAGLKNVATEDAIVIHQHHHAPKPSGVSKANSLATLGVPPEALPKFLRRLGVPVVKMPGGPHALLVDVEQAMRARGIAPTAPATPEPSGDDALARAGLRMVGGGR